MQRELLASINNIEDTVFQLRNNLSGAESRQFSLIKDKDIIISDMENENGCDGRRIQQNAERNS